VVDVARRNARNTQNVTILHEPDDNAPVMARADGNQMRQVLWKPNQERFAELTQAKRSAGCGT
jgi:hypothetical protein